MSSPEEITKLAEKEGFGLGDVVKIPRDADGEDRGKIINIRYHYPYRLNILLKSPFFNSVFPKSQNCNLDLQIFCRKMNCTVTNSNELLVLTRISLK